MASVGANLVFAQTGANTRFAPTGWIQGSVGELGFFLLENCGGGAIIGKRHCDVVSLRALWLRARAEFSIAAAYGEDALSEVP